MPALKYFALYKPFGTLSQFTDEGGNPGLSHILNVDQDVYPVGRLDTDSEGLLLLTNDRRVNNELLNPNKAHWRTYLAQVEGEVTEEAIMKLTLPMVIRLKKKDHKTLPARAELLTEAPDLPERIPPIRFRASIPTSWIRIAIREGKNRQVRKMTANVGFPTLRLVREGIESLTVAGMKPGELKEIPKDEFFTSLNLRLRP